LAGTNKNSASGSTNFLISHGHATRSTFTLSRNGDTGNFGAQEDYAIGIGWRIGPGGLFDLSRQRAARARLSSARIGTEKIRDEISRQIVDAFTRLQSQADQINRLGCRR